MRSWNTKLRGNFLIYASIRPNKKAADFYGLNLEKLLRGYIIGYARLVNVKVYKNEREFLKDKNLHLYLYLPKSYPIYGFILENVHKIEPIPYRGNLGFFKVPDNILKSKNL